jgi:hypothetical protein
MSKISIGAKVVLLVSALFLSACASVPATDHIRVVYVRVPVTYERYCGMWDRCDYYSGYYNYYQYRYSIPMYGPTRISPPRQPQQPQHPRMEPPREHSRPTPQDRPPQHRKP